MFEVCRMFRCMKVTHILKERHMHVNRAVNLFINNMSQFGGDFSK